jgi:hypothetical protein
MPNRTVPANGTGLSGGMERKEHMATKSLTTPVFGIPSAEVLASIEAESTVQALREANFKYEAKRRDLEDKFGGALAALREQYLAEVLEIHGAEAA